VVELADIDLVTIAALAQTIVLAVTMGILILQFRSQARATKDAAYQKVMDDYNDVVRMLVNRPELTSLLDDLVKTGASSTTGWEQLSSQEKTVRSYLMIVYGLLEKVYTLYEKRWIDESTWKEWETWLVVMARHPLFVHVHVGSQGMFNRAYQDHVSTLIDPKLIESLQRRWESPRE
jgi:hypothetical protein